MLFMSFPLFLVIEFQLKYNSQSKFPLNLGYSRYFCSKDNYLCFVDEFFPELLSMRCVCFPTSAPLQLQAENSLSSQRCLCYNPHPPEICGRWVPFFLELSWKWQSQLFCMGSPPPPELKQIPQNLNLPPFWNLDVSNTLAAVSSYAAMESVG